MHLCVDNQFPSCIYWGDTHFPFVLFFGSLVKISWSYMCGIISRLCILLHFLYVYINVSNILCWFLKVLCIVYNEGMWCLEFCAFCSRRLWFCGSFVVSHGWNKGWWWDVNSNKFQCQWCGISGYGITLFFSFCSKWSGRFHYRFFKVQGCSWPLLLMSRLREDQCVTDIGDSFWDTCSSLLSVPALYPSPKDGKKLDN